jgi:hypothetical protein
MTRFILSSQSGHLPLLTFHAHLEEAAKRMNLGNPSYFQ